MRNRILVLLAAMLACCPVMAQQSATGGTLTGTIEDPTGAIVGSAKVVATREDTKQSWTATASTAGFFRFSHLPSGQYVLIASAAGMVSKPRPLMISSGQAFDVTIRVGVAETAESLTVSADPMMIETVRSEVAEVVTTREVEHLPLNGRNYLDLALLVPGVSRTNTGSSQRFAETSAVPGTGISISSQRNLNNSFVVDGLSANDDAAELAGTFLSQEVIREFQVVTAGGVAEFGGASGGFVNVTTRSGNDELHASVYGFLRNARLDAKNPFTQTKLPLTQAQYGATAGGPLVKTKTFWFGNFEQTRQNGTGVTTIPDPTVSVINARLIAAGYPGPLLTTGTFPMRTDTTNVFVRLDHTVSKNDQLTLRYGLYIVDADNVRNAGALSAVSRGTGLEDRDDNIAINNVWTTSPNLLQESRFQWTRSNLDAPVNDLTGPAVNISGVASFGTATFSPTRRDIELWEASHHVTWNRGAQSLKLGVDFFHDGVEIDFPGAIQGVYLFSNMANFLNGSYVNFQQAFGLTNTHQSSPNLSTYVQDEIRLHPRLTINAGLRYDIQFIDGRSATDTNNVSPRIGFAWTPTRDGSMVVRGAYGMYYDRIPLRAVSNALQRDGVHYQIAQLSNVAPNAPLFPNVMDAFPAGVLTNITTMDPGIRSASSHQFSVQVERQFTRALFGSVGYTGLRGEGLIMSRNINVPSTTDPAIFNLGRPHSSFANNGQFQSIGNSWYDGLTAMIVQRPTSWASMRLSYTFSKALDTAGNFFFSTPQDNQDVAAEKGRSDNDQRHRLVLSGTVQSPVPNGRDWKAYLTRGWALSSIFSFYSATPFNIQTGNDRNGDTNANDRPSGVGRNTGEGFPFRSWDARLSRVVRWGERWQAEFMVEGFNLLNSRNDLFPNNIFGTGAFPTAPRAGFGKATAAADPRQLQFGFRLRI